MSNTEAEKKLYELALEHGVLVGSQGLGLGKNNSDYDYIIDYNLITKALEGFNINSLSKTNARGYFNVLPPLGNCYRITFRINTCTYDLICFPSNDYVEKARLAFEDLKCVPLYMLEDKQIRILLFEKALKSRFSE